MHFIDDKDAVTPRLRRDCNLLDEQADVLDTVVGGGVEFHEIIGIPFVDCPAGFAFSASFPLGSGVQAVHRACEYPRA